MPTVNTRKPLSLAAIDRLKPGEQTSTDMSTPGLYVQCNRDGSKSWRYVRKVRGTVIKRTYGTTREFSLPEARAWALDLNRQSAQGIDLNEERERQEAEAAATAEAERLALEAAQAARVIEEERQSMTVAKAFKRYMDTLYAEKNHSPHTLKMKWSRWDTDINDTIGKRPITDVEHDDLWAIVEAKKDAGFPSASNHLVADIKVFFRWCMTIGRTFTGLKRNPAADIIKLCKEKARTRTFSPSELRLFLRALAAMEDATGKRIFTLLLLSGQRLDNVLRARTAEWCNELDAWEIARTKNGEPNVVPLSPWGKSLFATEEPYLFPSVRGDGPRLGHIAPLYRGLRAKMAELGGCEIERWTPHDMRRVIKSGMSRLRISANISERVIAHTMGGVEGIYDRYDYLDEKREALAKWEAEIIRIAREESVADALGIPAEPVKLTLVA